MHRYFAILLILSFLGCSQAESPPDNKPDVSVYPQNISKIQSLESNLFNDTNYSLTKEELSFVDELFTGFDPQSIKDKEYLINVLYLADILINHFGQKYKIGNESNPGEISDIPEREAYIFANAIQQKKNEYLIQHSDGYSLCFDNPSEIEKARQQKNAIIEIKKKEAERTGKRRKMTLSEVEEINNICGYIWFASYYLADIEELPLERGKYIDTFFKYMHEDDVVFGHFKDTSDNELRQRYLSLLNTAYTENTPLSRKQLIDLYSFLTVKHYRVIALEPLMHIPGDVGIYDFGPAMRIGLIFIDLLDKEGLTEISHNFARKMFRSKKALEELKLWFEKDADFKPVIEKIIMAVDPEGTLPDTHQKEATTFQPADYTL